MKLALISDLHLEFVANDKDALNRIVNSIQNPGDIDILCICGDISSYTDILIQALNGWSKRFPHVLFVCGNHEFYHNDRDQVYDQLRSKVNSNVHILENDLIQINDQRFLGCTLWFKDDPLNQLYERNMNDFSCIPGIHRWIYDVSSNSYLWIKENLTANDIVLTHHIPSDALISSEYMNSTLNRFFVHDCSLLISAYMPKLWLYGHTHTKCDTTLGDTRCVCNPRDYPGYIGNKGFQIKTIEV